jgi:hypothetical protein
VAVTLLANEFLEAQVEELRADVSKGYLCVGYFALGTFRSGLRERRHGALLSARRIAGERTDTKFTLADDDKPLSYVEGLCQDRRAYACVLENIGIVLFQLAVSPALKEVGGKDIGHVTSC